MYQDLVRCSSRPVLLSLNGWVLQADSDPKPHYMHTKNKKRWISSHWYDANRKRILNECTGSLRQPGRCIYNLVECFLIRTVFSFPKSCNFFAVKHQQGLHDFLTGFGVNELKTLRARCHNFNYDVSCRLQMALHQYLHIATSTYLFMSKLQTHTQHCSCLFWPFVICWYATSPTQNLWLS